MRAALLVILMIAGVGCGGSDADGPPDAGLPQDQPDTSGDADLDDAGEPDTGEPDVGQPDIGQPDAEVPPSACAPDNLDACFYRPASRHEVAAPQIIEGITYTDDIGQPRSLAVAIYRPLDAPEPMPLVVLSHGGSGGKTDPLKSMDKWAPTVASAGYLAVAIAHPGRDEASNAALCAQLQVPDTIRCAIKLDYDRPHDVATVLDFLTAQAAPGGALEGLVDLERIAHFGHSAGAGCAMMLAGASRNYACAQPFGEDQGSVVACNPSDLLNFRDDRIDAALAFSPQGPDAAGFMTESFDTVAIPLFTATGANDGDPGEPDNRRGVFDALGSSDDGLGFTRLFIDDQGAKHTLFEAETDACADVQGRTLAQCQEMRRWLFASALAFLDWHLRGLPEARVWLSSTDLETAAGGRLTFELK